MSHHPCFTLGALCSLGGLVAYKNKGSLPSLIGGLTFGGLYILSGYLIKSNKENGHQLATVTSGLLVGMMAPRAIKTRGSVPISMMTLGLVGGAFNVKKWYEEEHGV